MKLLLKINPLRITRNKNQRTALFKNLVQSLIWFEKIETTEAKAKELRPFVEKLVTAGRAGTLSGRRSLIARVGDIGAAKIIRDISPRYIERKGGYTRITKLPQRLSDGSPMAVVEFV